MTNKQLLSLLERIHVLSAQGILSLRERIENEDKFTQAALDGLDARMKQNIGNGQALSDGLPDYRAYAEQ